jgi:hypothetical protein
MIKVFLDKNKLIEPEEFEIILSSIKDYVPGYDHILSAINEKRDIKLYIQNPTIEIWIKRMASRYPEGAFDFQVMDARKSLAQKWNISIPDYVTNEDIIETGLLKSDIAPRPGDKFEEVILGYFYDPVFALSIFPSARVIELISAYDESKWQNNVCFPLIARIYQNHLTLWQRKAKNKETGLLVAMIEEDIGSLKSLLVKYKVLRSYKEIGIKLLDDLYRTFDALKFNLQELEVDEEAIPDVINQITYYLNELKFPKDSEEVYVYVNNLSGLLMVEFHKVEAFLTKNPDLITQKVNGALEAVFNPIKNRIQKRLEKIKALLKPAIPQNPDPSWTADTMIRWATDMYIPFFVWAESNGFCTEELFLKADLFSQWLYNNWEDLRANWKKLVFNVLPNHYHVFQNQETVNLLLIIDNLGWKYAETLKDLFQKAGFGVTEMEAYLSMLPTETELSKKCLLSGVPRYNEIDRKQYAAIVEKGWVPYFNDFRFHYLPDVDSLLKLKDIKYQTYVVNYLSIDKALHQPESLIGLPHDVHINTLLSFLVEKVVEFTNTHSLKDRIVIHVTSDHGSTKIPNTAKNDIDMDYFKDSDFEVITPRHIAVKPERFLQLPENMKEDCFFLDQGIFGNDRFYLATRRSNRFTKTDSESYIHGGLSPEEVIVPYMSFQKISARIEDLELLLTKSSYRYRLEVIDLEIANPNEYPVENIMIEILNSNIESEVYRLDWLDAKRKASLSIQGRFKKTQNEDDVKNLSFIVTFECGSVS